MSPAGSFIELAEIESSVGIIDVSQSGQSMQSGDDLLYCRGIGRATAL
jgi:hypothetical protein